MNEINTLHMFPGTMCDERLWGRLSDALSPQMDLHHIAIEKSKNVADMHDRIFREVPEQANIIGFSMGGYLALEFGLKYPQRVSSLVMICASADGLTDAEMSLREKYIHWLRENEYKGMSEQRLKQFIHPKHVNNNGIIETIRAMDRDLGKETLIFQMQETSYRKSLISQLPDVDFPVLLIGAEEDNFVKPDLLNKMADAMPKCQLRIVESCGHMLPLERPNQLANILETFYATVDSGNPTS